MAFKIKLIDSTHGVVRIDELSEIGLERARDKTLKFVEEIETMIRENNVRKTLRETAKDRHALNAFLDKAGYRRQGDLVFLTPVHPSFTREIRASERAVVATVVTEISEMLVFNPQGIRIDRFRKNPIVLYNHDYEGLPVARSLWERVRDGDNGPELITKPQFHMDTELSREVWQLVVDGKLAAWELGVVPAEWEKHGDGFRVTKWDVLEYSVVPRPENMSTLRYEQSRGRISSPALVKSIPKTGKRT